MRGLPSGDYLARVSVCDVAGNTTSQITRFTWHPSAGAGTTPSGGAPSSGRATPAGGPAGVTTALQLRGARPDAATFGRQVRITGLLTRGADPVTGSVEVLDPSGQVIGSGHTLAGGRLVAAAVATRGGVWRVRTLGQDPGSAAFRMSVRPRVTVRAAARGGLLLTGVRLAPAMANRVVRLQVLRRGRWTTQVTSHTTASGTVRISVPQDGSAHRIEVPAQTDWPYAAATVRVRAAR